MIYMQSIPYISACTSFSPQGPMHATGPETKILYKIKHKFYLPGLAAHSGPRVIKPS